MKQTGRLAHVVSLLRYGFAAYGPLGLVASTWSIARQAVRARADDDFDARYGTDTASEMTPEEAGVPPDRRPHAVIYWPTPRDDFQAMVAALGWSEDRRRAATFVDLGSGKGRVVFLAAESGFGSVRGVEISSVLTATAAQNLERWKKATGQDPDVRLACGDAGSFDVPAGPFVLFLYHPFDALVTAEAMERVDASLRAEPRDAAILYRRSTTQRAIPGDVFGCRGRFAVTAGNSQWTVWSITRESAASASDAGTATRGPGDTRDRAHGDRR